MNNKLLEQLSSNNIDYEKLDESLKRFIETVSATYDSLVSTEVETLNQQLRQESAYHYLILNNLKSAIAAIEPESDVLRTSAIEGDDINYLTNSLIKLVSSQKALNLKLKERAEELEKVNTLLTQEKDKLAREKAQDKAILFAIADGLVVTNLKGEIVLVNKSFEQIIDVDKNRVIGKRMSDIVKLENKFGQIIPEDENIRYISMQTGVKHSTPVDKTHYYIRPNGSKFPVFITVAPIIIANQIVGSVEIFRDITTEEELNKSKTEFVSIASHQLRTPLSAINWYTELLQEDEGLTPEDMKQYLNEIVKAKERMSDIINALLDVSRIELGTFKVNPEDVDIDNIINTTIKDNSSAIQTKNIQINIDNQFKGKILKLDNRLITIIFQNIVGNAIKYSFTNGTINVGIVAQLDSKDSILIKIEDFGLGIPKKDQGQIFTKMFRADNIKKVDTDGNGLGLYIVKSIIDVIGGKIWFESEENKGTTFFVEIPSNWEQKNK